MRFRHTLVLLALSLALVALGGMGEMLARQSAPVLAHPLAATTVGGVITQSVTWNLAGSPYVMNTSVIVTNGVTLTIEPGVIVQGTPWRELRVLGTLNAIGTMTQPITFTGSAWLGLVVDGGSTQLRRTTVEYGCYDVPAGGSQYTSNILVINDGYLDLADSTVQHCDYGGGTAEMMVRVVEARAAIHATTFSDSQWYPLDVAGANSVVTLTDNIITNNGYNRILVEAGALMNANTTLYPQAVWQGYEFVPGFNIPASRTLTLQPGVIVANAYNAELRVYGQLNAIGTVTQPITLTAAIESDSNGWPGLLFDGPSATGDLRHVTVRYAQSSYGSTTGWRDALAVRNVLTGEVRIESSRVISTSLGDATPNVGIYVENSHVLISDTLLSGIGVNANGYPLRVKGLSSIITLTHNTFTGNFADRVLLEADALLGQDTTLVPQTGLQGYEFATGFSVPATRTLTLAPGTIMQGQGELRVYGQLNAIGTAMQPVTLTRPDANESWPGLLFDGAFASGDLQYVNVQAASSNYGNASGMCNSLEARNVLTHQVHLAHSQITDFGGWCDNSGLYAENSHVVVEDTVFASLPNYAQQALRVTGNSTVLVSRSQIESNSGRALLVEGDTAFVRVVNSTLIGNGVVGQVAGGVRNTGRAVVILGGDPDAGNAIFANQGFGAQQVHVSGTLVATYNWWGSATGPAHASNPGGLGEDVSDRVVFTPWLTTTPALPTPDSVHVFGPRSASPGEMVNLGLQFQNPTAQTLHDVVLVADLPREAEYVDSPEGTLYMKQRQIFWRVGDLAPGQFVQTTLRVRFRWGLPAHLWTTAMARVVARNFGNPALDLDTYLNYQGTYIVSQQPLTRQQVTDTLASDAALNQLILHAQGDGFDFYGSAYTVTLSDGTSALDLVLMPRDPAHGRDLLVVRRADDLRFTLRVAPDRLTGYDGGLVNFVVNVNNRQFDWGTLPLVALPGAQSVSAGNDWQTAANGWQFTPASPAGCQGDACKVDESTCVRNCLVKDLGLDAIGDLIPELGMAQSAAQCVACASSRDPDACSSCAVALYEQLGPKYTHYLDTIRRCLWNCKNNEKFRNEQVCAKNERWCGIDSSNRQAVLQRTCDTDNCNWLLGAERVWSCHENETCVMRNGGAECCNMLTDPTCPCVGADCDRRRIEIRTGDDPNALYGPAEVVPGERVTYTVEFENVGAGTAYGVYVMSELSPQLDDRTIQVSASGAYFSSARLLIWNVGAVAPHTGGSVSFSARVPTTTVSGTVILAQATIYFPSVPQTTPTNDLVSVVRTVAARSQRVETSEGVPVAIALQGGSPANQPLSFQIVQSPRNGQLTGVAPALTYTPDANFEGLDELVFRASDGITSSAPAQVSIVVNTGAESVPPEVVAVSPMRGAQHVHVYPAAVYSGSNTFEPGIWVQFSEPISATTITTQTFRIVDGQQRHLAGSVAYDAGLNRATYVLSEPLRKLQAYTVTLTSGVHDTSGNPLAAGYAWGFRTEANAIYLPVVLR